MAVSQQSAISNQQSARTLERLPLGRDGAASRNGAAHDAVPGSLTRAASTGVLWAGVNTVSRSAIRFVTTVILARLLAPEDFGIFGMAMMVNEIVSLLGGLGLGLALIQRQQVDERYFHTVFWANLAVGAVLAVGLLVAAPVAAAFFQADRVKPVVMVMALNILLASAGGVHRAILTRQLAFQRFAVLNITAASVRGVVSLALVFAGAGLWALVGGMVAERLATLILLVAMVPWRPRLAFHRGPFLDLFRFSRSHYADNIVRYFNGNTDALLTGRLLGPAALGFYQMAYNLPHLVLSHFSEVISEVLFPVYCKVQDDHARLQRGYTKTVRAIALVTFPLMAGLSVVAPEFIRVVYGAKWLPATLPMRILCVAAAANAIFYTIVAVLNSKGRPDIGLKWNLVMLPVTAFALLMAFRWGMVGIAAATSLLALCSVIPLRITMALIGLRMSAFTRTLLPAGTASALMVLVLLIGKWATAGFAQALPASAWLAIWVTLGASVYVAAVWGLWRGAFADFVHMARKIAGVAG